MLTTTQTLEAMAKDQLAAKLVVPSSMGDAIRVTICVAIRDKVPLIYIDTPDLEEDDVLGPKCRIYLNDDPIFEGVPYPTESE